MSAVVIDTNVLLVADGQANHMTPACKIECLDRLQMIQSKERVVLDHQRMILTEYGNKLNPSNRPCLAQEALFSNGFSISRTTSRIRFRHRQAEQRLRRWPIRLPTRCRLAVHLQPASCCHSTRRVPKTNNHR